MNTATIKEAADRIVRYKLALQWLEEYGHKLAGRSGDEFSLSFHPNLASACLGAKEAKEVIEAFAKFQIEQIVKDSIANCRNTIEIDRDTILREASNAE